MLQPAKAICELLASTPQGGVDAGAAMDQVEGTAELVVKSVSVVSCHWQPAALLRPFRPKLYDDCIAARPTRTQAFVATLSWIGRAFARPGQRAHVRSSGTSARRIPDRWITCAFAGQPRPPDLPLRPAGSAPSSRRIHPSSRRPTCHRSSCFRSVQKRHRWLTEEPHQRSKHAKSSKP